MDRRRLLIIASCGLALSSVLLWVQAALSLNNVWVVLCLMLWIALVFLAIDGAADMVSSAFRNTILQEAASDEVRGRLQGVVTVVVPGGPRLADAVHGAAAAAVGTTIAAAGGGGLVLVGVMIAALLAPAFVRYRVSRPRVERREVISEHALADDKV